MSEYQAELAVRSFYLYYKKYYMDKEVAFVLPDWFVEARTLLSKDQVQQIRKEETGEIC